MKCDICGAPAVWQGKFNLSGGLTGKGYCDAHRLPDCQQGRMVPVYRSWQEFRSATYVEWRPGFPGYKEAKS